MRGAGNVGNGKVYRNHLIQLLYFAQEETEVQRSKLAYPRPQHAIVVELEEPWVNLLRAKIQNGSAKLF